MLSKAIYKASLSESQHSCELVTEGVKVKDKEKTGALALPLGLLLRVSPHS